MSIIYREQAIDALWKALYEYEDKTEKQFQESADLDIGDWIVHRIFVQNMSDIDRQTILNLPSAEKTGKWTKIEYADEVNGYLIPNYECSQCGYWSREDYDYCPNCGTLMQKDGEA